MDEDNETDEERLQRALIMSMEDENDNEQIENINESVRLW